MGSMENREIEAKFLDVDKEGLIAKLKSLGAEDLGEDFLREIIFYDKDLKWQKEKKRIMRLRKTSKGTFLTFKHDEDGSVAGMKELEITVSDMAKAKMILEEIGLVAYREQEKQRHKFKFGEVIVDIDQWPKIPAYVEIEGPSEEAIKAAAEKLGFEWGKAVFGISGVVIEKYYGIPVYQLRKFKFEKVE